MRRLFRTRNRALSDFLTLTREIYSQQSNRGQRYKRLFIFIIWQIWKRTVAKPLTITLFNGYRFRAYPDCSCSSDVMYFRIPDFREVCLLRRLLDGGEMIDIGSNVGMFTLLLADRIDHAILFEPNYLAAQRALDNITINDLDFEVHNIALSDKEGEIFLEDRGVSCTNRILIDPRQTLFPIQKIRCISLDVFLKNIKTPIKNIAFIKIDVEGHENSVLNGMKWTLANMRPKIIMFEYLQRTNFYETRLIFDSVGYSIFYLDDNDNLKIVSDQPSPLQDLFAMPKEYIL